MEEKNESEETEPGRLENSLEKFAGKEAWNEMGLSMRSVEAGLVGCF